MGIIFKVVIFALIAVMTLLMWLVGRSGIKTSTARLLNASAPFTKHKQYARKFLALTILLVILIRVKVMTSGGLHALDSLFWVHLGFAIAFFINILALNFWITGEKNPIWHWVAASTLAVFFMLMVVTAIPLVLRS